MKLVLIEILSFREKAEVEFIGTEKYPKLYERFGKIEIKGVQI